jgi:hypothetical protein
MHTVHGTVRTTSSPRNHADSDGQIVTGGNFRHSHAATRDIRSAHIITKLHKLHSQLVGIVTALMYQVACFMCSFVCGMGLQPDGFIQNSLASDAHQLFFHLRPANQPTITVLDLCHTPLVHLNTRNLISTICISLQQPTLLGQRRQQNVTITSLSLPIDSTLNRTNVTEYNRRTHCDTQTQ